MMLSRWQSTIVDAQGNVQPGARLVVFLEETQERAQVYRDRDGTDPYPLGEVVANEWGYAYFYAAPDSYRITSAPLAIDWREVVVAGEWLLEAESNAAQSAAQALLSAQSATASAATASDSASAASDSAANAESSETNAAGSAASAQSSATQASNSAADAASYASSAAQSASDSASYADSAQVFSQDAESSKTLAEQWAQNPEDDPVETGQYSAYHWAKKAEGFVGGEAYMQKSANLSDAQDAAQARTNLGLGTAATKDTGTGPDEVPTNSDLGTAATRDVGTGANEVPANSNLGAAAYLPIATTSQAQELTNDATVITPKKLGDALNASGVWVTRAIGEEVWLDDSNPAVDVPPTDSSLFRYIKLTAGENGSGGYNEGVLINESVSGSAPLIEATAEVNLPDSPFHGQTVRLLNTERRFVRAGEAGVVQDDQMQRITGTFWVRGRVDQVRAPSGAFSISTGSQSGVGAINGDNDGGYLFDSANSPDSRASATTDGETRPRNIGRTVYMRIL